MIKVTEFEQSQLFGGNDVGGPPPDPPPPLISSVSVNEMIFLEADKLIHLQGGTDGDPPLPSLPEPPPL